MTISLLFELPVDLQVEDVFLPVSGTLSSGWHKRKLAIDNVNCKFVLRQSMNHYVESTRNTLMTGLDVCPFIVLFPFGAAFAEASKRLNIGCETPPFFSSFNMLITSNACISVCDNDSGTYRQSQ